MVAHIGATTIALQLSFFLISSQSCSDPPLHQNESRRVHRQQRRARKRMIRRYFTVKRADCRISKAYSLQKDHFLAIKLELRVP
jgi:hypothetical protein